MRAGPAGSSDAKSLRRVTWVTAFAFISSMLGGARSASASDATSAGTPKGSEMSSEMSEISAKSPTTGLTGAVPKMLPTMGEGKFVLVDISPDRAPKVLLAEILAQVSKRQVQTTPLEDGVVRRMLSFGQTPADVAVSLLDEANSQRRAGDCARAVTSTRKGGGHPFVGGSHR